MREPIDSWDPFDVRPRKSAWQAFYIGATNALLIMGVWALVGIALVKCASAETIAKRQRDGSVKLCESKQAYPLLAFCVILTIERR